MLNALEPWHLLIIVGVLVVLFGAKRLPGSARSLGRSMRIFKSEMANGHKESDESAHALAATVPVGAGPAAIPTGSTNPAAPLAPLANSPAATV